MPPSPPPDGRGDGDPPRPRQPVAGLTSIAIIDPQFRDDPDVERAVCGPDIELDVLRPGDRDLAPEMFVGADAIIDCRSRYRVEAPLVAALDGVRVLVQSGVGYNHIDLAACAGRGLPVCNVPDYRTTEVADHAIAIALSLVRGLAA